VSAFIHSFSDINPLKVVEISQVIPPALQVLDENEKSLRGATTQGYYYYMYLHIFAVYNNRLPISAHETSS